MQIEENKVFFNGEVRISRRKPLSMEQAVAGYIRAMRIAAGLNTQRIFEAWDKCSGAGKYTIRRFFRDGRLFITLNSSVVRMQMQYRREDLVRKINEFLESDSLFTKDDPKVGYVKEIILK